MNTDEPRPVSAVELAERFAGSDGAFADDAETDGGYAFASSEDQIAASPQPTTPAAPKLHRFTINVDTLVPLTPDQQARLTAAVKAVRLTPRPSKTSKRHPGKKKAAARRGRSR